MKNECLEPTTDLNESLIIPEAYNPYLNLIETEEAIKKVKDVFQKNIAQELNLYRVSAPIAVLSKSGINDALNGIERPIGFEVKDINENAEIVHSLAKWKRLALSNYGLKPGEGLYTDMNALRPDEELDNLHSIYVDQWDWEKIIIKDERNLEFLKNTVKVIYDSLKETEKEICSTYKKLPSQILPDEIYFIHTEELEEKYPYLSPKERENLICEEKKAVFIIGIGGELKNGHPHDGRAADYDDWTTETSGGTKGLNGDIVVWNPVLNQAYELSSMGIRVDNESLLKQLKIRNESDKVNLFYHQKLLNGELPLSIGGGIGQSRLCMFFLRKAHIGEVQSSIWSNEMKEVCKNNNIFLL